MRCLVRAARGILAHFRLVAAVINAFQVIIAALSGLIKEHSAVGILGRNCTLLAYVQFNRRLGTASHDVSAWLTACQPVATSTSGADSAADTAPKSSTSSHMYTHAIAMQQHSAHLCKHAHMDESYPNNAAKAIHGGSTTESLYLTICAICIVLVRCCACPCCSAVPACTAQRSALIAPASSASMACATVLVTVLLAWLLACCNCPGERAPCGCSVVHTAR